MVEPWDSARLNWTLMNSNPYIDKEYVEYILYQLDNRIRAGWTNKNRIPALDEICDFVVVDKNTALNITEQKYNELLKELNYRIKKRKLKMKLDDINKDFV
jgi:hypothetical protein